MKSYSEKRDYLRMPMDCPARLRIGGEETVSAAIVENLSSSGVLFLYDQEIPPDTRLTFEILPGKNITAPFSAEAHVVRNFSDDAGNYHIACGIDRVIEETEIGPDFP